MYETPPATITLDPIAARIVRGLMLRLRELDGGDDPAAYACWFTVRPDPLPITVTVRRADPAHGWSEPLPEAVYFVDATRDPTGG